MNGTTIHRSITRGSDSVCFARSIMLMKMSAIRTMAGTALMRTLDEKGDVVGTPLNNDIGVNILPV